MDIVLEHGGEDLNDEGDTWEIITDPAAYEAVAGAVKAAEIPTVMSEVTMVASTYTKLEGNAANQMIRLLEALGGLRRHAKCLLELRYGRRADGTRRRLSRHQAGMEEAARLWRSFFGDLE